MTSANQRPSTNYLLTETGYSHCVRYKETAVCHFGPDGSFVYTNEIGWGIPATS